MSARRLSHLTFKHVFTHTGLMGAQNQTKFYTKIAMDPLNKKLQGLTGFCDGHPRKNGHEKAFFVEFLQNPKSDPDNLWLVRKLRPSSIRFKWFKSCPRALWAGIGPKLKMPMLNSYLLVQTSFKSHFAGRLLFAICLKV